GEHRVGLRGADEHRQTVLAVALDVGEVRFGNGEPHEDRVDLVDHDEHLADIQRYRKNRLQIGRAHLNSSHGSISYAVFCLTKKRWGDRINGQNYVHYVRLLDFCNEITDIYRNTEYLIEDAPQVGKEPHL